MRFFCLKGQIKRVEKLSFVAIIFFKKIKKEEVKSTMSHVDHVKEFLNTDSLYFCYPYPTSDVIKKWQTDKVKVLFFQGLENEKGKLEEFRKYFFSKLELLTKDENLEMEYDKVFDSFVEGSSVNKKDELKDVDSHVYVNYVLFKNSICRLYVVVDKKHLTF